MRCFVNLCGAGVLFAGVLGACSGGGSSDISGGGGGSGAAQHTTGPYEPLAVGASWTYQVQDSGSTYQKTSTVLGTEDAGGPHSGISAFKLEDTFPADKQNTWYQVDGQVVKRLHDDSIDATGAVKAEDWYDPYRLRVDETPEHTAAGAGWSLDFTDSHSSHGQPAVAKAKTDQWHVDGVDEAVTVGAGSFFSLHVTRTDPSDGSTKSFWFVRGVGKVKETGSSGHTEELTAYTHP